MRTVENESKIQKKLERKQKCRGAKVERRKYNISDLCRESKGCRTWCRSKYVQQSCVDLEQRLVEAAQAGAVTPMINSLPAT